MMEGIDVSGHQTGSVTKTTPGISFAIVKLTQNNGPSNDNAALQIEYARQRGLALGFYHFPEYDKSWKSNADAFLREVEKYLHDGDNVCFDHEAEKPYYVPDPAEASDWGNSWLEYVGPRLDRVPWVYSNRAWATDGHCNGMRAYPWWGAAPGLTKGTLRVYGPFARIVAHQYSWSGGLDRDVFYGTRQDWVDLAGGRPAAQEGKELIGAQVPTVKNVRDTIPVEPGSIKTVEVAYDASWNKIKVRIAPHRRSGHGYSPVELTVGGVASDKDNWPAAQWLNLPAGNDVDWVSVELVDGDPTMADPATGKTAIARVVAY